jgi:hypothetical protein
MEEDEVVSSETFELAKKKGFDLIHRPTQTLMQKLLRKKHEIIVLLEPLLGFSHIEYSVNIYTKNNVFSLKSFHVASNKGYEKVLETGLLLGLSLIKTD